MIELPESIQNSKSFSKEQVEQLGRVDELPTIDPAFEDDKLKNIFQYYSLTPDEMEVEVHKYAAVLIDQGKIYEAWQVLLSV